MKKLAVLTSLVFVFGISTFAMADPVTPPPAPAPVSQVNGNDIVQAEGAAANDGGTAVAVKDNLNGNSVLSGNSSSTSNTATATFTKNKTEVEDSYNTDNSNNDSINTFGVSKAAFGSASNVGSGSANVAAEYHVPGEVTNTTNNTPGANSSKSNADNYNKQEVEAEDGSAATMTGDASVDSRDQSTHTKVEAEAEEGSLAAINTTGNITYDKSTTITIKDIGLALQKNELKGEVEKNVLIVGGPEAKSITKSGETETGDVKSGKAKVGDTESEAKSKSGSGAFAGASGGSKGPAPVQNESFVSKALGQNGGDTSADPAAPATASAESHSGSSADSSATGGSAQSGNAQGGDAEGGSATGAAASASTTFYTGANSFTTGSFNGLGSFNVNSGVSSLQQSPISINAVVGGSVAGK